MTQSTALMKFARYQLPAFIWGLVIFVTSSIPSTSLPKIDFLGSDKVAHTMIFFLFAGLTHRAIRFQVKYPLLATYHLTFCVIITAVYGVVDELHQYFVPGREVSMFDLLADLLGAALYVAIASVKAFGSRKGGENPT
jgi:VanZ family protein